MHAPCRFAKAAGAVVQLPLREDPERAYIEGMTHSLAFLLALLAAGPVAGDGRDIPVAALDGAVVLVQAEGDTAGTEASESGTTDEVAADPVAAWEADPSGVLPAEGVDLDAFEYLARPLVIFGDSPRQPQVVEQLRLIEAEMDQLAGRDVAVILDTDPEARSEVRRTLRPRGFALVLLDKDGRVTLRRPAPLSVREIARAIDRTPLRQEELRNGREAEPTN